VRGEATARVVLDGDLTMAFLDHRPLFPGHCLLLPREHHETLLDLPSRLIPPLFSSARLLARAIEQALGADGTFVAINNRVSQSVPHLHVHVVPRRHRDGLRGFFWPRVGYENPEAAARVQSALQAAVAELQRSGFA
jgi:histidine triad (HIT) family protein